jgi:LPS-assembly protein
LFTGSSMRADTFQQLVLPEVLFDWLSVVPRAGGRYTFYSRAPDTAQDTNDVSRAVGDLGMAASFKVSRTWTDVQNERWHIDGLRHIIEPFADYQWVPSPNVKTNDLFQFDTIRNITITNSETMPLGRYLTLDFPAYNEIDAITRENTLRFGLRQRLQTQRDGQPWDLVDLTCWTDWNIEQNPGDKESEDLFGTLELRPVEWFAFDSSTRYDYQDGVLREFNTEARVHDGDLWSVGLGTRYLKDDSNLVSASVAWRLSRRWVVQVYERYDMQDGQWEEQDYMLRQEMHDWYINYGFRYNQQQGGDEKAFFVTFTLKAFPGSQLAVNR